MQKQKIYIYIYIYLFNAREIEMKTVIDPTKNLVSSNKVSTIHYTNVRRHFSPSLKSKETLSDTQMQYDSLFLGRETEAEQKRESQWNREKGEKVLKAEKTLIKLTLVVMMSRVNQLFILFYVEVLNIISFFPVLR